MLTDISSILQSLTNVNPPITPTPIEKLSRPTQDAYFFLEHKRNYWASRKGLMKDGSFFLTNKDFAYSRKITRRGVIKIKQRLRDAGLIRYAKVKGRYGATFYSLPVFDKKEILKTPTEPQERPPLDPEAVRQMVKLKGKDFVLNCEAFKGYSRAEIEECFED
jgi:hypothetical protein